MCRYITIVALLLPTQDQASTKSAKEKLIVDDSFEKWDWIPIAFGQRKEGRQRLKEGRTLPFEHRGPLLRISKGFILPSGRMVDGKEAFKGKSSQLQDTQVGLHGRYSSIIKPNGRFRYEVALKGKGTFSFRAWVGAKNKTSGQFRWMGFPDLIKIKTSDKWKVYRGNFTLPDLNRPGFQLPDKVSAAIVVNRDDVIFVDEFRVWEVAD